MTILKTITLITILIFLLSCKQTKPQNENDVEIVLPDTSVNHRPNTWYLGAKNIRRQLNLKNLELGVDSIEIRIYQQGGWNPNHVIIIKNENKIWSASVISYHTHLLSENEIQFDTTSDTNQFFHLVVDSAEFENLIVKSSWNNLLDSLQFFGINTLPSQQDIKGFEDRSDDGIEYHFEIATKHRYKFYTYHCPAMYSDNYNQSIVNILGLINRELKGMMMIDC
ncbi:MAG: hypothetical protein ABI723_01300 [Bacteroidia bacterium]